MMGCSSIEAQQALLCTWIGLNIRETKQFRATAVHYGAKGLFHSACARGPGGGGVRGGACWEVYAAPESGTTVHAKH
jgi:hypothetical protein